MVVSAVDLFSGCGGLSLGFHQAAEKLGFETNVVAAVDDWEAACASYEANLGVKPMNKPVATKLVKSISNQTQNIDLLLGGPPCQGFSTVGNRAIDDPRNKLVKEYMKAVKILQPKCFVMENVSGFVTMQRGKIFEDVVKFAKNLGYEVHAGILLSSAYGVAQHRRRCFIVGVPEGTGFSLPTGSAKYVKPARKGLDLDIRVDHILAKNLISFNAATSDLPAVAMGGSASTYLTKPQNTYQKNLRNGATQLEGHAASMHNPNLAALISYIPEGLSAHDPEVSKAIPKHLRPTSGFSNTYARIKGQDPAPTITRNFATPSAANCIHPTQDRALTLREAARCQSFPDTFVFKGTVSEQRLQVGNAVPPLMSKSILEEVLPVIGSAR